MKVVKNTCYGGFSLSPLATKRYAELKGKECYFFEIDFKNKECRYIQISLEVAEKKGLFWSAYSVQNPNDYKLDERDEDGFYKSANERAEKISIDNRPEDRTDPDLIKVVEELGKKANGECAELEIVEIPDGVEYFIDEYDGMETIRENHRSW